MLNKDLISPCGLYCGVCGIYYATVKNDRKLKEKLAAAYHESPDKIACHGCLSSMVYWYCSACPIKSCTIEKGHEGCYQCAEFPCNKVESFPVPEGKKNILRAVPEWRRLGTEEWVKAEEKFFSCATCGSILFRGGRKCRECGAIQ
jgi:hypothetical protein